MGDGTRSQTVEGTQPMQVLASVIVGSSLSILKDQRQNL